MKLEEMGWNIHFDRYGVDYERQGLIPARVFRQDRLRYHVSSEQGEVPAELAGRLRHQSASKAELPAVGDWVGIRPPQGDGPAIIRHLIPRRSGFSRKVAGEVTDEQVVAANVDTVFLVVGLDHDFNLRRLERYLTLAWESGAAPVIVLNKADLCEELSSQVARVEAIAPTVPIHAVSAVTEDGTLELSRYLLRGATVAFLGSSGVGKSSLINRLLDTDLLRVREVRSSDGRGQHTTTFRELFFLPSGAMVIDTPGMRELRLWGDEESLEHSFADIEALAESCRFRDCSHQNEPGCAVLEAVEQGELDASRLGSYLKLRGELQTLAARRLEHPRQQERAVGRRMASMLREIQRRKREGGGRL